MKKTKALETQMEAEMKKNKTVKTRTMKAKATIESMKT